MTSTTTSQDRIIFIEPEGENEASERAQLMVVRNSTTRLEQDDNYSWTSPFIHFMEKDDWKSFKNHIDLDFNSGAEARKVNEEGETFLHRAVASGKEQFVIELAKLMSAKDLVLTDRDGYTALHLAVEIGKEQSVIELVKLMSPEDLMLRNRDGCTALYLAAISGTKEMAKIMVEKNKALVLMRNVHELPVVTAARHENTDMVHYLYEHTPKEQLHPDKGKDGATLLTKLIISNLFDIALDLLEKYPTLAISEDYDGRNVITVLARKPSAFPSGRLHGNWHLGKSILNRIMYYAGKQHEGNTKLTTWIKRGFRNRETKSEVHALQVLKIISTQVSKMDDKQLKDAGVYEAVIEATKFGIVEFVYEVMKCNRLMVNCKDTSGKGPFLYAIMYRQEKIFNRLQNMRDRKSWFSYIGKEDGNNTLHQAAIYNRFSQIDRISGVALQIQRELQWFKEVEKLAPPILKDQHNNRGMTPRELFAEEHAALAEKGEKWIKETARGCMVVAALIATVVFTAAFTVPGGIKENGDPNLLNSDLFMFFIIVDALSLFSSCSSMLIFLAILTSRYAEQDFLFSLPRKLILGLSSLFFSIGTMMAAFCATLFITVRNKNNWVPITSTILALLPITLFIMFQCPLLLEMSYTTYGRKILAKTKEVTLF